MAAVDQVRGRVGPWTSHSIHLGHGVYTRDPEDNWRVDLFSRIMRDFGFPQIAGIRILDLACLEGLFAIEYARQGALTVGIEGRAANVEKALFARDVLGLSSCTILQDDVRNLEARGLGNFDVVLCAGILYHLNAADAIEFIRQIARCTNKLAIFDTHIAPDDLVVNPFSLSAPMSDVAVRNEGYRGRFFQEHPPGSSSEAKASRLWASLDNDLSFWFSKASLHDALKNNGFAAVYDALRDIKRPVSEVDRVIFAALK